MFKNNLVYYGDICAVPMFGLLIYYLWKIKNKTFVEFILLVFAIIGFVFDLHSSLYFLFQN